MPTLLDFVKFINRAYAAYSCDSFGNDTIGKYIWENKDRTKDLIMGDGSDSDTFPSFVSNSVHNVEYYHFDGIDEYISNWPEMPDEYTVVASKSTVYQPGGHPYIDSCNNDTIKNELTVAGGFSGNIHNILIFDWILSPLELLWCEQYMLRRLWRDIYVDPFTARLIRGEDCQLCFYHEKEALRFYDYSMNTIGSTDYSTVWNSGLTFPDSDSALVMDSDSNLNLDELTIFIDSPNFAENCFAKNIIIENGTNYSLSLANGSELKQMGQDESGSSGSPNADFHLYSEFTCPVDAYLSYFRIYSPGSREVKPNIYIANGSVYNRVWYDDSGISVVAGWNNFSLDTPLAVYAGSGYAFCFIADGIMSSTTELSGKISGYKLLTYSTFTAPASFDPTADGYTQKTTFNLRIEAYGYLADNPNCIVRIGGSDFSFAKNNHRTLAISCKNGEKPLFYLNGRFAGQGDSIATVSSAGAGQLTIGNNTARNNPFNSTLKKLSIYSTSLSDAEIRAAHIMALVDRPFTV
jgi:hypothetical protein